MAAKCIYSFAAAVLLLNSVAFAHLVQCNGVTAPEGDYDDLFICTDSQPPLYAPLTETLTSIDTAFACETECYTRGHTSCSFSVYDAYLQTCAIYHSSTPPGPVVDVAPASGISNTIFLNTICTSLVCGQVYTFKAHDYLIRCTSSPWLGTLESCIFNLDASASLSSGGTHALEYQHTDSTCTLQPIDGCTYSDTIDYAIYIGPHGGATSLPTCGGVSTTATSTTTTTAFTTTTTSALSSTTTATTAFTTTTATSLTSTSTAGSGSLLSSSADSQSTSSASTTVSDIGSSTTTSRLSSSSSSSSSVDSSSRFTSTSSSSSADSSNKVTSTSSTMASEKSISSSPTSRSSTIVSASVLSSSPSSSAVISAGITTEPICPRDDGKLYSSQVGNVYEIECDGIAGANLRKRATAEKRLSSDAIYVTCINSCDFITGCLSIIYTPASQLCRAFTTFVLPTTGFEFGAQLRTRANGALISGVNTNVTVTNGVNGTVINGTYSNCTSTTSATTTITTTVLFFDCPVTIICTTGQCGVTTGVCSVCQPVSSSPAVTLSSTQPLGTQIAGQASSRSSYVQVNPTSTSTVQLSTNSGVKNTSSLLLLLCVVVLALFT